MNQDSVIRIQYNSNISQLANQSFRLDHIKRHYNFSLLDFLIGVEDILRQEVNLFALKQQEYRS